MSAKVLTAAGKGNELLEVKREDRIKKAIVTKKTLGWRR